MTDQRTLADHLGLEVPRRSESKPRDQGLTMIMDQGWPTSFVDGMLDQFGEFVDIVKIWDPQLYSPLESAKAKIEAYRAHNVHVQPGGIFLEIAKKQGKAREMIKVLGDLGCDTIEVSSTTSTRADMNEDLELVAFAKDQGMIVVGEVGRKFPDGDETRLTDDTIDVETTVREFQALLSAGASKVYWEGHLLRRVLGDSPRRIKQRAWTGTEQVRQVAREVGQRNILFEASGLRPRANRQWLQFWLVRLFGPDVNIANARIEELANLEAIRRGSHPIFGFGSSGNYPWIRSQESGEGSNWWRS